MKLSLGARQLLTFLRRKSGARGYCRHHQDTLARAFDVNIRTIRRWVAELVAAEVIKTESHGHGNHYIVMDLARKMSSQHESVEKHVKSPANVLSDRAKMSYEGLPHLITENIKPENKINPSERANSTDLGQIPDFFRKAQREAIERAVAGCGLQSTPELLANLARKAQYYGVTGFVIAAHILRAWNRVAAQPSNHPRGAGWVVRAVENELAAASKLQGAGVCDSLVKGGRKPVPASSLVDPLREPPEPDVVFVREIEGALTQLAKAKAVEGATRLLPKGLLCCRKKRVDPLETGFA